MEDPNGDSSLNVVFTTFIQLLSGIGELSDIETVFILSRVERLGCDLQHRQGSRNDENIDLHGLWLEFGVDEYSCFVSKLLSWCYENDDYHNVSDVCDSLFGALPDNEDTKSILMKGISDETKSERLRERFKWIYSRQF